MKKAERNSAVSDVMRLAALFNYLIYSFSSGIK